MINNFEETKKQLAELAPLLNSFKSEAVQLKIIDLIFTTKMEDPESTEPTQVAPAAKGRRKRKAPKESDDAGDSAKGRRRPAGNGPVSTLDLLIQEGFFKKRQAIGKIVEHCSSAKARSFKANEISGPLGRLARNNRLKREKNADGQYEYFV